MKSLKLFPKHNDSNFMNILFSHKLKIIINPDFLCLTYWSRFKLAIFSGSTVFSFLNFKFFNFHLLIWGKKRSINFHNFPCFPHNLIDGGLISLWEIILHNSNPYQINHILNIQYTEWLLHITGLSAKDLKKGFFGKPNPYVRMCIVPRFRGLAVMQKYHGQQAKTIAQHNTVNPSWKNEVWQQYLLNYL